MATTKTIRRRSRPAGLRAGGHTAAAINNMRLMISVMERQLAELRNEQRQRDRLLVAALERLDSSIGRLESTIAQRGERLAEIERAARANEEYAEEIYCIVAQFPEVHRRTATRLQELSDVLRPTIVRVRAAGER